MIFSTKPLLCSHGLPSCCALWLSYFTSSSKKLPGICYFIIFWRFYCRYFKDEQKESSCETQNFLPPAPHSTLTLSPFLSLPRPPSPIQQAHFISRLFSLPLWTVQPTCKPLEVQSLSQVGLSRSFFWKEYCAVLTSSNKNNCWRLGHNLD